MRYGEDTATSISSCCYDSRALRLLICLGALTVALGGAQAPLVELRGAVTDRTSGAGIVSAHVYLSPEAESDFSAETITDNEGRFVFRGVPKGTYTVSAKKSGYVTLVPDSSSRRVSVTNAELASIGLSLTQAAVITGNVSDTSGQPMRGARVAAVVQRTIGGAASMVIAAGPIETDDRGSYRIYGLTPGRYSVVLLPDGASPGSMPFAPVYFPGSIDPDAAQFFDLQAGESRSGVDLTMLLVAGGDVQGMVTNIPSSWRPGRTAVALLTTTGLHTQMETVVAGASGDFVFHGVPPGIYQVAAWGPSMGFALYPGQHWKLGSRRIRVEAGGLDGVEVTLHDFALLNGVIQFEPGSNAARDCFSNAQLTLHPADPIPNVQFLRASLPPNGRFTIRDVPIGLYALELQGLSKDCFLWGASFGQGKLEPGPIAIEGDGDLTIFLSTQMGEIAGTVVDLEDKPVAAAKVLAVPLSKQGAAGGIDDVFTTFSGEKGQFSLPRVPPGHYRLLAVAEVHSTDYLDPSYRSDHGTVDVEVKSNDRAPAVLRISR